MTRKTTNLVVCLIVVAVLIGAGIGVYFYYNNGPIVGRIKYGERYYMTAMRPTERFNGATVNRASYLIFNENGTGIIHFEDLSAPNDTVALIVTNYKEGIRETIIELEYLVYSGTDGKDTKVQHLTAISTNDEIKIKAVESHPVNVIQQRPNDITQLKYEVTIMSFRTNQEAA